MYSFDFLILKYLPAELMLVFCFIAILLINLAGLYDLMIKKYYKNHEQRYVIKLKVIPLIILSLISIILFSWGYIRILLAEFPLNPSIQAHMRIAILSVILNTIYRQLYILSAMNKEVNWKWILRQLQ